MDVTAPLSEAWSALTAAPASAPSIPLSIDGPDDVLPSVFPVAELGTAAVASSLLAAAAYVAARDGGRAEPVSLDTRHVAAAFRSERCVRVNGAPLGEPFDPRSRFFPTADGWIRLHANYPWHRERLLGVLGVAEDPEAVGRAVARWPTLVLEDAVAGAGGCAAAVRTPAEWLAHPQGRAVAQLPLLEVERIGDASPAGRSMRDHPVRVLDLTRVIAGPVCTRTLAAHGADVLRIDSPTMPEPPLLTTDALVGKRSAFLDLRADDPRRRLEQLLAGADVVVQGYRPGALDRLGLDPAVLAARQPGLVVLSLSAWGHDGPWSGRRGFDSLVQAACGIGVGARVAREDRPGALPVQALDHATGYLAAAAVLVALARQLAEGGTWHARLSLAQTAAWLLRMPRAAAAGDRGNDDDDDRAYVVDLLRGGDVITVVAPPGRVGGRALVWPKPPPQFGADLAGW